MFSDLEVVVTGLGLASPIGIGREAFWQSMGAGASGIGPITLCDCSGLPVNLAGEVKGFEPKQWVRPKKSLKIMSRTMQLGVTAGTLAWEDAGIGEGAVEPDRIGVVFGVDSICTPVELSPQGYAGTGGALNLWVERAHEVGFPLQMLKILPNLATCHLAIALDARGPTNTHHHGDVSSLMALYEAVSVIQRGAADVVVAGGTSSLTDAFDWARSAVLDELSTADTAAMAPRPFAANRDGQVRGEGAGAFVLESRAHAEKRGANILARIVGFGAAFAPSNGRDTDDAIVGALSAAMARALTDADLQARDLGHVNAHGLGTVVGDRLEAAAIAKVLDNVPVTAPKSYFGNLAAASGAIESAVTVLSLANGELPPTLNAEQSDPDCPINVVKEPLRNLPPRGMVVGRTNIGQAAAMIFAGA